MKTEINNAQLLADSGLKVVHCRTWFAGGRDVTVAYRLKYPKSRVIEIATAITNPGDTFTKKIGTKNAIENFLAGRTVLIPDQYGRGPTQAIRDLFA